MQIRVAIAKVVFGLFLFMLLQSRLFQLFQRLYCRMEALMPEKLFL